MSVYYARAGGGGVSRQKRSRQENKQSQRGREKEKRLITHPLLPTSPSGRHAHKNAHFLSLCLLSNTDDALHRARFSAQIRAPPVRFLKAGLVTPRASSDVVAVTGLSLILFTPGPVNPVNLPRPLPPKPPPHTHTRPSGHVRECCHCTRPRRKPIRQSSEV